MGEFIKNSKKAYSDDYMSADELKTRFFEYFRDSGTFADLRSQLRSKLVHEMFKMSSPIKQADTESPNRPLLPLQVSNWLVYDHLKRLGYEYSLSTFVNEANFLQPKNLLSIDDILHLLGIDNHSPEYNVIYSAYIKESKDSFIYVLLDAVLKKVHNNKNVTQDTSSMPALKCFTNTKETKEFHLSQFYPTKIFREISEENYSNLNSVKSETESLLHCRLQLEKEKHENELSQLRQKLRVELDALYAREQQMQLEIERKRLSLLREQEELNLQKEKLQIKETELNNKLRSLESDVEVRVASLKESLLQKEKDLNLQEVQFIEKQQRLEHELHEAKEKLSKSQAFENHLSQLQQSYKLLQDEYSSVLNENERLKVEIKHMSDYSIIKEELIWKSKKLEHFEKELNLLRVQMHDERMNYLDTIQKLQHHLASISSTQQFASQIQSIPAQFGDSEKQSIEKDIKSEYKELLSKIEDQKKDILELHRLLHNMHYVHPSTEEKATSPVNCLTTSTKSNSFSKFVQLPEYDSNRNKTNEMRSQMLYKEVDQTLENLLSESEAIKNKYSSYLASKCKLFPDIYIPHNSPYFSNSNFVKQNIFPDMSKNIFTAKHCVPDFDISKQFQTSFKSFDHLFLNSNHNNSLSKLRKNFSAFSLSDSPLDDNCSPTQSNSALRSSNLFEDQSKSTVSIITSENLKSSLDPIISPSVENTYPKLIADDIKSKSILHDNLTGNSKGVAVANEMLNGIPIPKMPHLVNDKQVSPEGTSHKENDIQESVSKELTLQDKLSSKENPVPQKNKNSENIENLDTSNPISLSDKAVDLDALWNVKHKKDANIVAQNSPVLSFDENLTDDFVKKSKLQNRPTFSEGSEENIINKSESIEQNLRIQLENENHISTSVSGDLNTGAKSEYSDNNQKSVDCILGLIDNSAKKSESLNIIDESDNSIIKPKSDLGMKLISSVILPSERVIEETDHILNKKNTSITEIDENVSELSELQLSGAEEGSNDSW